MDAAKLMCVHKPESHESGAAPSASAPDYDLNWVPLQSRIWETFDLVTCIEAVLRTSHTKSSCARARVTSQIAECHVASGAGGHASRQPPHTRPCSRVGSWLSAARPSPVTSLVCSNLTRATCRRSAIAPSYTTTNTFRHSLDQQVST